MGPISFHVLIITYCKKGDDSNVLVSLIWFNPYETIIKVKEK